jgi:SHS family lactate transporter-like MFS transporter
LICVLVAFGRETRGIEISGAAARESR